MSADLIDFRAKITAQTHAVLCAVSDARGIDMSELTREVLHEWASRRIDEARHIFGAIPDLTPIVVDVPAPSPFKREALAKGVKDEVFSRGKGQCSYCGMDLRNRAWNVDHIKPVVQGGDNSIGNLALSCVACNFAKGGRTPEQWKAANG